MDDSERRIDAALGSYPLSPLPPGFTPRLMARLALSERRFRLDFLDLALPGFFLLFGALSLALLGWALASLDPYGLARWRFEVQMWLWRARLAPYWPLAALAAVWTTSVALGMIATLLWLAPPRASPARRA